MNRLIKQLTALVFVASVLLYPRMIESQATVMYENQVAVLVYHHIDDRLEDNNVTITPDLFRRQLVYLQDRGYNFISLEQFRTFMSGGAVPVNAVLVTFDDGYRSYYTHAFPILQELDIPAVHFIITNDLDRSQDVRVPFLSKDEIRKMVAAHKGKFDFECHSDRLHHKDKSGTPYLISRTQDGDTVKSDEEYEKTIVNDTKTCVSKLNELQPTRHDAYAYPYGMFDKRSVRILGGEGIRYGFTTLSEMATGSVDPMQIPRINAGSPYVQPSALHNLITFKTVTEIGADQWVPLGQTVMQIGGSLMLLPDQSIQMDWDKRQWIIHPGSTVVQEGDRTIQLDAPIERRGKRNYIRMGDLQKLIQQKVIYNKNRGYYHVRNAPDKGSQ
ncbi:polysaccharide deacetylase family protein [Paenibacillus sp. MBLB4367]|uniref:polysaccharide deacetylase family protein n=1 Tax=Paenibacillus sp. MBLB4367 TaxID=3384767 RepID=UPI0039082AB2